MKRIFQRAACLLTLLPSLAACQYDVLHPEGPVANREVWLIVISSLAMLIVVLPAIGLTFIFAWRYRASNKNAVYDPDFSYSRGLDVAVWLVPVAIVCFLTILTWRSTIALDPYKRLPGNAPVLHVEVVGLDWKWLFIYPDQHVAAVNQLVVPVGTQVAFDITSDTVMDVFFIPQLGTQIYGMPGMVTRLHLVAKNPGSYRGINANFSGAGFADMHFETRAVSQADFATWVRHAAAAPIALNDQSFEQLAGPTMNNPVMVYRGADASLFRRIVMAHAGAGPALPQQKTE